MGKGKKEKSSKIGKRRVVYGMKCEKNRESIITYLQRFFLKKPPPPPPPPPVNIFS
jgi:hypothetical protein